MILKLLGNTMVMFVVAVLGLLMFSSSAHAARYVKAYWSNSARTASNYTSTPAANQIGGTVKWGTSSPGSTTTLTWGTQSGDLGSGTKYFQISPSTGYSIKFIRYIDSSSGSITNVSSWTSLLADPCTVANGAATTVSFSPSSNKTYHLWVEFELTASATHTVTALTCDPAVYTGGDCSDTCNSTVGTVTFSPSSILTTTGRCGTVSYTGMSNSENTTCELTDVDFVGSGDATQNWTSTNLTLPSGAYTTPKVSDDSKVYARFSHIKYQIDINKTGTCGSLDLPSGKYVVGSKPTVHMTVPLGCAISSVTVVDPAGGYSSATDVTATVTAYTPSSYTFGGTSGISGVGSITVNFITVSTSVGREYCQVPPFTQGQTGNHPNVLIIFDNSLSMGSFAKPYSGDTYSNLCNSSNPTPGVGTCPDYYGYFVSTAMYSNPSSNVYDYDSATAFNVTSNLSGNKLNHDYMQKVDIVRQILIGGKLDPDSVDATSSPKVNVRGAVNLSAGTYEKGTGSYYYKTNDNKIVQVVYKDKDTGVVSLATTEPTGLLHDINSTVRLGLMVYNANGSYMGGTSGDGGRVISYLTDNNIADMVTKIEAESGSSTVVPTGLTPLAETLYEATRYFRAMSSSPYQTVDYSTNDPVASSCQQHYVVLLTDGEPTCDQNIPGASFRGKVDTATGSNPNGCGDDPASSSTVKTSTLTDSDFTTWWDSIKNTTPIPSTTTTTAASYSNLLARVAYYAHTHDMLRTDSKKVRFTTYPIFVFGNGSATLQETAKFGAFEESNTDVTPFKPDVTSEYMTGTVVKGYYQASTGQSLKDNISTVFSNITAKAGSGTAAAVANNKSGERGANMIQALFYQLWPEDTKAKWMGEIQALWYYLDPVIGYSGIYADTTVDKQLNLLNDKVPPSDPRLTKALWRAGAKLQIMSADDRKIYTPLTTSSAITHSSNEFKVANLSTLRGYMNLGTSIDDTTAGYLINYVRGSDGPSGYYRPRKVSFYNPTTGALNTTSITEWKLGDIINSTPTVQSAIPINAYDKAYLDSSYSTFYKSNQYKSRNMVYSSSNDGLMHAFRLGVVTNINDSAHPEIVASMTGTDLGKEEWAFIPKNALPYLQNQSGTEYCHQCLVDGAPLLVDASIFKPSDSAYTCTAAEYWNCERKTTVDSAGDINATKTSWGTVLVSGMGLGGASRDKGTTTVFPGNCNETLNHDSVTTNNYDCISTPKAGIGLSSYFALDVTKPMDTSTGLPSPKFMWEFSDYSIEDANAALRGLGLTTAGAAIVRINAKTDGVVDKTKNGRWFAVFASGPTGTLFQSGGKSDSMFRGRSDQNLKIYIVDLNATMPFSLNSNYWVKDTGIKYAFASSLAGSVVDLDRWDSTKNGYYSDDVVYITYTRASLTSDGYPDDGLSATIPLLKNAWDKGGIMRLVTKNDPDPANWFLSSLVDGTGPITSSIGKIQDRDNKKLWIYFGEGRYFYSGDETGTTSVPLTRKFYGVQDPCYKQYSVSAQDAMGTDTTSCPAVSLGVLQDQGGTPPSLKLDSSSKGWYITMDTPSGTAGSERVVSDVTAATNGIVFYTTFTPNTDICTPGGTTSLWAVKYDTGGTPPTGSLVGKAPVQTSSGGITLVDLGTKFTAKNGRKLDPNIHADGSSLMGMASGKGIRPLLSNKGLKRILQIQEQ